MYYSLVSLLAIALHMIINHDVLWGNDGSDLIRAHKQYRIFLFSVLAFYTTDLLWGILDELRWTVGEYADTVVFFIAMMVSAVFWMRYIIAYIGETNKFSRLLTGVGIAMIVLQVAVLIVNFFVPVMFWFDADGAYQMGVARYLTLILQTLLFLMTSVYVLVVTKRTKQAAKRLKLSVGLFGVSMVILIFIQLFFPLMPYYAMGYMLGTCVLHSFVVEDEKEEYRRELENAVKREQRQKQELVESREALRDALAAAENANHAKTAFLSNMSQSWLIWRTRSASTSASGATVRATGASRCLTSTISRRSTTPRVIKPATSAFSTRVCLSRSTLRTARFTASAETSSRSFWRDRISGNASSCFPRSTSRRRTTFKRAGSWSRRACRYSVPRRTAAFAPSLNAPTG